MSDQDEKEFIELITKEEITRALTIFGQLVDSSLDTQDIAGLDRCLEFASLIEKRADLTSKALSYFFYIRANIYAYKRSLISKHNEVHDWNQIETFSSILNLRRSIVSPGLNELDDEIQIRIYVNLANDLSYIGRLVEAMEQWEKALAINPAHAMALGNLGLGKQKLGELCYDPSWRELIFRSAYNDLLKCLSSSQDLYPEVKKQFAQWKEYFKKGFGLEKDEPLEMPRFKIEKENGTYTEKNIHYLPGDEYEYRVWCLKNNLFLNPLSDIHLDLGARDNLHLPRMISSIKESYPHFYGLFNQIKQEFITARHMFYEGVIESRFNSFNSSGNLHYADKEVLLYNTLDYPAFSINTEKLKLAYRSLYSIFDKIAFFLNEYFEIGLPRNKVYFTNLFSKLEKLVKNEPEKYQHIKMNWPLRGLNWLAKDIIEEGDKTFHEVLEPDATQLKDIRNHLEHKFISLHIYHLQDETRVNKYSESISKKEFEAKALKLMKLVRSSIMNLSHTLVVEEDRKRHLAEKEGKIIPDMPLTSYEDEWKGND